MGTAVDPRAPKNIFGAAIGGCLTMCICGIGPISGAALNPTRAYGPIASAYFMYQIYKTDLTIGPVTAHAGFGYIYLMPFLGSIAAAFMYSFLFLNDKTVEVEVEVELRA